MTTTNDIRERLSALRQEMRRESLGAFIFPSTDPHCGEYVPDHWKGREWISGFDGSAGTAVVTLDGAALWTDSRYFLAAEEQLEGTEFTLMRERMDGTPTIAEWIGRKLATSGGVRGVAGGSTEVAIDGMVSPAAEVFRLKKELKAQGGLTLRTNLDVLSRIWKDRPEVPLNPIIIHPEKYAGESYASKMERIRAAMRAANTGAMLVSTLDDIAWALNLRGTDVHCNPVFVAYLFITDTDATLFTDPRKLTPDVTGYLRDNGIGVSGYADVKETVRRYDGYSIMMDGEQTPYTLYNSVRCREVIDRPSPIGAMKAVKNDVEIDGFRRAMVRDGRAMVKWLRWLKTAVARGGETELSVSAKLRELRAEDPMFRDISFDTIAAYQEHGAIVHYEPTPATDKPLRPEGLLLVDSGAQYPDGTTDITRTIALGPVTEEQRRIYTLVLKGHIQLQMLRFPQGASGTQLDAVARRDLWAAGLNYMHGTGHGVGSYLNVHEGPHQIRQEYRPAPMKAGMTVTCEPGIYLAGRFGVRIENTLLTVPHVETEFGRFLRFETLTLCPIDTAPVIDSMLTDDERQWLNDYHLTVRQRLTPLLDAADAEWLRKATEAV